MKPHVRRGVECIVLLFLTGGFAQLDRATARGVDPAGTQTGSAWSTAYQSYAGTQSTTVGATIRTFASTQPDFNRAAAGVAPGRYQGIMGNTLDAAGLPVFASTGHLVTSDWRDSAGNPIIQPRSYLTAMPGDTAGALSPTAAGAVDSAQSFNQWYRDVPGVNTSSRSSLSLAKQGSTFVFDGSLDAAAGTSKNYTAQADWHFVYEKDSNWYIDVGSNAEVWLYIDGMLVIDGGGVGGVKFDITNGTVVTQEPCDASVTIVGAAIGSGSVNWPVTTRVKVGSSTIDPFGSFTSSTAGNVNDNKNPRTASLGSNIAAGTSISVLGQSWEPTGKTASSHMIVDSGAGSKNVKVLRNGDTCPNIAGFGNQASASTFLAPYIDPTSKKITIQPNQIIYLYELYTTDYSSAAADFQDLVVLVTLNRPAVTTTTTSTTTTYSAAPSMSQRIDLSRIPWLEDHSDHQITLFFANRTGAASNLRIETNISTLNLANYRTAMQQD